MVTVNRLCGLVRCLVFVAVVGTAVIRGTAEELPPSRAAWWLAEDRVEPIADLVNTAEPGRQPTFVDRVGKFQVKVQSRSLDIIGDFPEANIWRFDLTTFDDRFGLNQGESGYRPSLDPNGDGVVDLGDFGPFNAQYRAARAEPVPALLPVPSPAEADAAFGSPDAARPTGFSDFQGMEDVLAALAAGWFDSAGDGEEDDA